jgi:uncharacterized membrane-anchored protein
VTDLERIQRLTYVNAALTAIGSSTDLGTMRRYLERAGLRVAAAHVENGATVQGLLWRVIDEAESAGLLPEEEKENPPA